ncbi:hypothetical protein Hanom_Chr17g01574701 [Helianthus anomalus]
MSLYQRRPSCRPVASEPVYENRSDGRQQAFRKFINFDNIPHLNSHNNLPPISQHPQLDVKNTTNP